MNTIGIIPSRYASSRLPGKPLCMIHGKSMIERVHEQAGKAGLSSLYVATDDARICAHVDSFGGKALMTSDTLGSGTERCHAAALSIGCMPEDIVVNIQGDEPFINPLHIQSLLELFKNPEVQVATLYAPVNDPRELHDPGIPKLVCSKSGRVLYFSRSTIPFIRNTDSKEWLSHARYKKHLGIYAYRFAELQRLSAMKPSELENAEMLEQLRWMENDVIIYAAEVNEAGMSVDTPEDLERAIAFAEQSALA